MTPFRETAAACTAIARAAIDERYELKRRLFHVYGDELLPAILGGRWQHSSALISPLPPSSRVLLDHRLVFRHPPACGRLQLRDAVLIGMPYHVFIEDGTVNPYALEAAVQLRARGLGVWARSDLSLWYPGYSQLVIATPALRHRDDAPRFGFTSLTDAPTTSPPCHPVAASGPAESLQRGKALAATPGTPNTLHPLHAAPIGACESSAPRRLDDAMPRHFPARAFTVSAQHPCSARCSGASPPAWAINQPL
jgi:hypothetical protein